MQFLATTTSDDSLGNHSWLYALCFIVLGIFFLYLLVRAAKKRGQEAGEARKSLLDEQVAEARSQELEWYREKRFLMEQQAREKQSRLLSLVESIAPDRGHHLTHAAARLSFLAESIREERQLLGTDISKLSLIDRRLRRFGKDCVTQSAKGSRAEKWLSEMSQCRHLIQSNREDLRKSQNLLRHVLAEVVILEEKARLNQISSEATATVIDELHHTKDKLAELPDGLRSVAKTTGERAQTLFKQSTVHVPDEDLHSVWKEQLTLDLFSSKHRAGGREELLEATRVAINAFENASLQEDETSHFWIDEGADSMAREDSEEAQLDEKSSDPEEFPSGVWLRGDQPLDTQKDVADSEEEESDVFEIDAPKAETAEKRLDEIESRSGKTKKEVKSVGFGDAVWASPINFGAGENPTTKKFRFNPFTPKEELEENESEPGPNRIVIFCSSNPEIWNSNIDQGERERAVELEKLSTDSEWLGIRRIDSGEEVFSKVDPREITTNGDGKSMGFNGSNEFFYGARHLGFFSEECVPEVETRFTYGGWGFGHLSSASDDEEDNTQVCGWDGKEIPAGTVFEFALYRELPEGIDEGQIIS